MMTYWSISTNITVPQELFLLLLEVSLAKDCEWNHFHKIMYLLFHGHSICARLAIQL